MELHDQEVTEVRDILLVLIIAAEHYSLARDGDEYVRLLTFCRGVCRFMRRCVGNGVDPFADIHTACMLRIKNHQRYMRWV